MDGLRCCRRLPVGLLVPNSGHAFVIGLATHRGKEALIQMMDDMAWGIEHRYVNDADTRRLTPDESRIRLAYQTAYTDLWRKVTRNGRVRD